MDAVMVIIGLVVGLLLGALGATFVAQRRAAARPQAEHPELLAARHESALLEVRGSEAVRRAALEAELTGATSTCEGLQRELAAAERRFTELVARHEREAAEAKARDQAESRVLQALAPVKASLETMQGKVTELETQRAQQHGQLAEQLKSALASEERLRSTAETLAAALKSNSTRGVWGETQLRSVVEAAGLIQHVDFDVQTSITSDAGAGRPDMVVHLPGGKSIAVDAKVPFTSYLDAMAIPATASDEELARRSSLMKAHVKALRDHITALGGKAYWDGLHASPEMVIAFIPSESLVSSALEADPSIMEFAFGKRVALASPVTLWSVLKTVAYSWQQDIVTEEAKVLFDVSRELHGRLAKMAEHVEKLGRSIESNVKNYNAFVGSLERQVLPSARKLIKLDPSKLIAAPPVVEEPLRELAADELLAQLDRADGGSPHLGDEAELPAAMERPALESAGALASGRHR